MYSTDLISTEVQKSPSFEDITGEFTAAMEFMRTRSKLEEHCVKFLSAFAKLGGAFTIASDALKTDWIEVGRSECGIELKLD